MESVGIGSTMHSMLSSRLLLLINFLLFITFAHYYYLVNGHTIPSYDTPSSILSIKSSSQHHYHRNRIINTVRGGNTIDHNNNAVLNQSPPNNLSKKSTSFYHRRRQFLPSSSLSTALSIRDSSNSRPIPAIYIRLIPPTSFSNTSTVQVEVKQITVTKLQLSQQLSCPLRDLRIIMDPAVSYYNPASGSASSSSSIIDSSTNDTGAGPGYGTTTALLPRKSGIIFHIAGHTRAIIRNDFTVLLFGHQQQQQERGDDDAATSSNDGETTASRNSGTSSLVQIIVDHLTNTYNVDTNDILLFELVVLEALLNYVSMEESKQASAIIKRAKSVLEGILVNGDSSTASNDGLRKKELKRDSFMVMQKRLGNLLPLKNRLDSLEAHCAEIVTAVNDLLHNEKEMKAMYLSRQQQGPSSVLEKPKNTSATSSSSSSAVGSGGDNSIIELELLLEDFLLQIEEVLYSLRQVQSSIKNTEEVVEIELDLMRNAIMRHELLLESYSFAASFAAAITGLFGMNLLNHMEYHKHMFYAVTVVLLVVSIAIARGIQHQLRTVYIL